VLELLETVEGVLCLLEVPEVCWRPWIVCSVCCALFAGVAGGDALRAVPHAGAMEVGCVLCAVCGG